MQKIDQKASILIWAIFLSIMVSMAFLSISTKIHKNIKNSGSFIDNIDIQNTIQNYLSDSANSQIYTSKQFGDNIYLEFENQNSLHRGLAESAHSEFQFLEDNTGATIQISLESGGPIEYHWRQNGSTTGSGVTTNLGSIAISGTGSLFIQNLGGNTNFIIGSPDVRITSPIIHYKIYRKIGNLKSLQTQGTIDNFLAGDF